MTAIGENDDGFSDSWDIKRNICRREGWVFVGISPRISVVLSSMIRTARCGEN
jgi:hypothetical protein